METHCLPALVKHTDSPAKTVSSDAMWAELSTHGTRTAIPPRSDICAAITPYFPEAQKKNTERFPCFYSSPLPRITNCLPTRRACCQVVPATAASSEQTAF